MFYVVYYKFSFLLQLQVLFRAPTVTATINFLPLQFYKSDPRFQKIQTQEFRIERDNRSNQQPADDRLNERRVEVLE